VMEFVPGSDTPLHTIGVPDGADALADGFGFVWVVSGAGNSVTRISARSGTVLPSIEVGNEPSAIAVGGPFVWVANRLDGTLSRIDPATATAKVIPAGEGLVGVAANDSAVWLSNERTGTLSQIDRDGTVRRKVTTGNRPGGLSLAGAMLYVAVRTSGLAHRGGTLRVVTTPFPIDPATLYDLIGWAAMGVTNDGLLRFERVGGTNAPRPVADLATSVPTPTDDGRTYTFQVRPGVHYSTGALVRPADFRRSIERLLDYQNLGAGSYLADIVGANGCAKTPKHCDLSRGIAVDAASNTVTFHLTAPDPDFLEKLAALPAYAVPADTPFKARLPLPATGPYMVKSFDPKHGLRLVRNPRFHEWCAAAQPAGYPDKIAFQFVEPSFFSDAQIDAVKRNRADYAYVFPPDPAPALRQAGYTSRVHTDPGIFTFYVWLNTRLAPFDDIDVRRALNYAVDRNRLAALRGGSDLAPPSCQVLAPNFVGYVHYCPYHHDLARAKRLVAASGTIGQAVTIWWPDTRKTAGDYLVSVLQSLGYKARLKLVPRLAYLGALAAAKGRAQAGFGPWTPDYPSSAAYFSELLTCASYRPGEPGNGNLGGFCDPSIDREIARAIALQTTDPGAAAALWGKIDHEIVDRAPWVTMVNSRALNFVSSRLGNYQYNPVSGPLLDQFWVR
jgi:peptide/nickel transport system substrate-binding protein